MSEQHFYNRLRFLRCSWDVSKTCGLSHASIAEVRITVSRRDLASPVVGRGVAPKLKDGRAHTLRTNVFLFTARDVPHALGVRGGFLAGGFLGRDVASIRMSSSHPKAPPPSLPDRCCRCHDPRSDHVWGEMGAHIALSTRRGTRSTDRCSS